jgi:hypothetical protein
MRLSHLLALIFATLALDALAQNPRSFVASYGNDAADCRLATPCRSFVAALAVTNSSGEIIVLDSAGYGGVTITKPVTITAPAGILAAANGTIAVNLPGKFDVVVLEGLYISNAGTGVNITGYGRTELRRLRLEGNSTGINVDSATGAVVRASDVDIYGPGYYGVYLTAAVDSNVVTFDRLRIDGVYFGIWVADRTNLTVHDCVITGRSTDSNENYGAILNQATVAASTTTVAVEGCLIANWYTAFGMPLASGGSGSKLFLKNNTIRTTLIGAFGHPTYLTITSFGDNRFIQVSSGASGFATQGTN